MGTVGWGGKTPPQQNTSNIGVDVSPLQQNDTREKKNETVLPELQNGAPGLMCWNGTSDPPYFLIYHAHHIFGLHDNIYVIYIYDEHHWKKVC